MSKRSEHLFQFTASQIRDAARAEAEYHEEREEFWGDVHERAAATVLETSSVELRRSPQTGGDRIDVVVDYGDPAAYKALQESFAKRERHREAADRFRTDAKIYGSQTGLVSRFFELDADDVHHFRLGGEPRED